MYEYKVSTITIVVLYNEKIELNLYNIANFMNIDDEVLGIKYLLKPGKILIRGHYPNDSSAFCNQISTILVINGKKINVKIFKNGTLQLTGCKNVSDANKVVKLLEEKYKLLDQKIMNIKLSKTSDGVLVTDDYMVYSSKFKQVIGYITENNNWLPTLVQNLLGYNTSKLSYSINNDITTVNKTLNFMSKKSIGNKRKLYSMDGEFIGTTRVYMYNNTKKLYRCKNLEIDYDTDKIMINDNAIGEIMYDIEPVNTATRELNVGNYSCSAFINEQDVYKTDNTVTSVNCINIVFNISFKLNRQRLVNLLKRDGYSVLYNPGKYCAVRLIYKIPGDIEKKANFMIFQSGKVIGSGFKDMRDIGDTLMIFEEIMQYYKGEIIIKNE